MPTTHAPHDPELLAHIIETLNDPQACAQLLRELEETMKVISLIEQAFAQGSVPPTPHPPGLPPH